MKYQLINYGDDRPDWARSVQAQLDALRAGPRGRWRRFRRCDLICRRCRDQLGEVMNTTPPVVVTRRSVHSDEHPHARALVAGLGDPPADDDPDAQLAYSHRLVDAEVLADRRARVSADHSWWLPLELLPTPDGPAAHPFELSCKCRRRPIWREELLELINGRTQVLVA